MPWSSGMVRGDSPGPQLAFEELRRVARRPRRPSSRAAQPPAARLPARVGSGRSRTAVWRRWTQRCAPRHAGRARGWRPRRSAAPPGSRISAPSQRPSPPCRRRSARSARRARPRRQRPAARRRSETRRPAGSASRPAPAIGRAEPVLLARRPRAHILWVGAAARTQPGTVAANPKCSGSEVRRRIRSGRLGGG